MSLYDFRIIATKQPCTRATELSFGYDIRTPKAFEIGPNSTEIIPTGVLVVLNPLIVAMICSRSGLSTKGIIVANSPGIIDADYRDEIKIILHNLGKKAYSFNEGDRIAQMVFVRAFTATDVIGDQREGGLGSTGA